jgi:hypothetical protein
VLASNAAGMGLVCGDCGGDIAVPVTDDYVDAMSGGPTVGQCVDCGGYVPLTDAAV